MLFSLSLRSFSLKIERALSFDSDVGLGGVVVGVVVVVLRYMTGSLNMGIFRVRFVV